MRFIRKGNTLYGDFTDIFRIETFDDAKLFANYFNELFGHPTQVESFFEYFVGNKLFTVVRDYNTGEWEVASVSPTIPKTIRRPSTKKVAEMLYRDRDYVNHRIRELAWKRGREIKREGNGLKTKIVYLTHEEYEQYFEL